MHVISRKRINEFAERHADAASGLAAWYRIVKARRYSSGHEVREDFPSASFLGRFRTVFNIGSQYRLVADIRYDLGRVYIRHVLTHAAYDRLSRRDEL